MKNQLKSLSLKIAYLLLMAIGVVSLMAVFIPEIAEPLLALLGLSGPGTLVANTALVSGPDTRRAAKGEKPDSAEKPGHLKWDISTEVTKIRPDVAALDTMIRKLRNSEKAEDIQVNFEEVEFRGRSANTVGAIAAPVDPVDPTEAEKFRTITTNNPGIFVEGELIEVQAIDVGSPAKPLLLRIDKRNGDGTLVVTGVNTVENGVPAIPDNTPLIRLAPSAGELKAQSKSLIHYPEMRYNYCQRFLAQLEQSMIRKKIRSNSGFGWNEQNYMKMYDFRTSIESAYLFSQKSMTFSQEENDFVFTTDGVFHQLELDLTYTTATGINNNRWIDWCKELFADDAGSTDRVLFGGKNLIAEILKIELVQKQLDAKSVEVVPGLVVNVVKTTFGNIMVYHHKLFDSTGRADHGMVLDLANIRKRVFTPLNKSSLKLKESGQRNVRAVLVEEISCLEARYLGTHAKILKTA